MPRNIDQMPTAKGNSWPPAGRHLSLCVKAEKWKSPKKGTAAVMLGWVAGVQSEYAFEDPIFVTEKAVSRLAMVASHVCLMPKTVEIPDSDREAAGFLAKYILEHAENCRAYVTIEVTPEQVMMEKGPDTGKLKTFNRSRVAFGGYDKAPPPPASAPPQEPSEAPPADNEPPPYDLNEPPPTGDDIPFSHAR